MGPSLAGITLVVLSFLVAALSFAFAAQQRLMRQLLERVTALEARPPVVVLIRRS